MQAACCQFPEQIRTTEQRTAPRTLKSACTQGARAAAEKAEKDATEPMPICVSLCADDSQVKLLLRLCPDLTHRDKQGFAALDQCREHLEMRAAVIMAQEQCNRLADGAQRNDLQVVEHLLEHGAQPRYKDAAGWTPLTWAVLHGSAEMARVLVRARLAAVLGANARLLDAAQAVRTAQHMNLHLSQQHYVAAPVDSAT
eukprot:Skav219302  [mRNA]  locus=scaffold2157:539618:547599:- [translate_table: standard]